MCVYLPTRSSILYCAKGGDRMTDYEWMLTEAHDRGLTVKEIPFVFFDGLIKDDRIGIRKTIETEAEKADVLAEEVAHYDLTVGDILDQTDVNNRRQERKARSQAYDMRIGINRIAEAIEMGCENPYEAAEYLGVSEKFFCEALDYYRGKYGEYLEKTIWLRRRKPHQGNGK